MRILECLGLSVVGSLCLTGCLATAADVSRISMEMERGEARVDAVIEDYKEGTATMEDVLSAEKERWSDLGGEIKDVAASVAERGKQGLDTLQMLLASGGITGIGGVLLSMFRNASRKTDPNVSNRVRIVEEKLS